MLKRIREMKDQDGFTLIELMVVVLIIAILIAIAIPTFLGLRTRAQNRSAQSDLRNALTAAKAFYTDNETFTGFNATTAAAVEPSLSWAATGSKTQIGIVVAAAGDIMLTKQSESNDWYCAAEDDGPPFVGASVRGPSTAAQTTVAGCLALPLV